MARRLGVSHVVFVSTEDGPPVTLRFFTAEGELPACGHGTVAALTYLAARTGTAEHRVDLSVSGRTFSGRAIQEGALTEATFAVGTVSLREPDPSELDLVLPSLGLPPAAGARIATLGRSRLLLPISTPSRLSDLSPDQDRLRDACDRLNLLGCYVHTEPTGTGHVAARMFAPSIGVPEDIANANSTACLAAHLSAQGIARVTADMGDSLGSPSTIIATAGHVGGTATISRVLALT